MHQVYPHIGDRCGNIDFLMFSRCLELRSCGIYVKYSGESMRISFCLRMETTLGCTRTALVTSVTLAMLKPCTENHFDDICFVVPAPFQVTSLQFHPDGNILMLMGKEQMCLCFLTDPKT